MPTGTLLVPVPYWVDYGGGREGGTERGKGAWRYTITLLLPMVLLVLVLLFRMCDITRAVSSPINLGGNERASAEWDRLQVLETVSSTMRLR